MVLKPMSVTYEYMSSSLKNVMIIMGSNLDRIKFTKRLSSQIQCDKCVYVKYTQNGFVGLRWC